MDANSSSLKLSQNIINQKKPNAAHKHMLQVYAECPDKEHNVLQLMELVNPAIPKLNQDMYKYLICADLKQLWQIFGMPVSPGKHPCVFCVITSDMMQIPLTDRGMFF